MPKELNQLTIDELGQLFPIIIVDYNPIWPKLASAERKKIIKSVGKQFLSRLEHIGSTSIPGMCAKPTIDFLLEISDSADCDLLVQRLQKIDYNFIPKPDKPPPHMMFAKGYTKSGIKGQTFHIHVRYTGDWDEIVFRDYLIKNQTVMAEYANLKRKLSNEFRNNREMYTESKSAFIVSTTMTARKNKV